VLLVLGGRSGVAWRRVARAERFARRVLGAVAMGCTAALGRLFGAVAWSPD
jgi:hypothetical protein